MKHVIRQISDKFFREYAFEENESGYYLMRRLGLFKNKDYCNNKPDYKGSWIPCYIGMEGPDHGLRPYAHIKNLEWGEMTDESLDCSVCEFLGPIDKELNEIGKTVDNFIIHKY